jgi:hypothetical protein
VLRRRDFEQDVHQRLRHLLAGRKRAAVAGQRVALRQQRRDDAALRLRLRRVKELRRRLAELRDHRLLRGAHHLRRM